MKLWVDADACPGAIKELIIRVARRLKISPVFVAYKFISLPDSAYVSTMRFAMGPEVVDDTIAQAAEAGDFVITQDIPLAAVLVPMGIIVINPRGELYTSDNIGERLSLRNFMQGLREAGQVTPGPGEFGPKERQRFADTLDRELTRQRKQAGNAARQELRPQ